MQNRHWMQRLADGIDLDGEPIPGVPVVELAGDRRVLIERHSGVTEYNRQRIGIRLSYGTVCVSGRGLELTKMTADQLIISGQIDGIQIQRRCR